MKNEKLLFYHRKMIDIVESELDSVSLESASDGVPLPFSSDQVVILRRETENPPLRLGAS